MRQTRKMTLYKEHYEVLAIGFDLDNQLMELWNENKITYGQYYRYCTGHCWAYNEFQKINYLEGNWNKVTAWEIGYKLDRLKKHVNDSRTFIESVKSA